MPVCYPPVFGHNESCSNGAAYYNLDKNKGRIGTCFACNKGYIYIYIYLGMMFQGIRRLIIGKSTVMIDLALFFFYSI